jgi:hypothetical protein
MSDMIGVFCFEATWTGWSDERLATELRELRAMGATAIVTETLDPPTCLMRAAEGAGLETHISVPCFSAHAYPELVEGWDVHPIQADGRRRRQMEWYTGVIPTHEGYNRALSERIQAVAMARPAGVILDFIRWPLHWELELRASTPEPAESSFDARSIAAFASWLEDRDINVGGDLAPPMLLGPLREYWTQHKCDVIARFACDVAQSVRAVDPAISLGAFIVPATEVDRRRLLGQDVTALSRCLDVLYPMTYHAILQEPPETVTRITADIRRRSSSVVVPVVQVTADRTVADPWDWGAEFPAEELGLIIDEALKIAPGVVLFSFEGLDAQRRDEVSRTLRQRQC